MNSAITKHTPFMFPWDKTRDRSGHYVISDADGHAVATVKPDSTVVEQDRLVSLFAAAPAMRAILDRLKEANDSRVPGNFDLIVGQAVEDAVALLATLDNGQ